MRTFNKSATYYVQIFDPGTEDSGLKELLNMWGLNLV